jgi:hypothetical protein
MASFAAEEFLKDVLGAKSIKRHGDELIHACLLPYGNHSNDHKNPGASLNSEKLLYNCFKCGSGGTLLWATEEILQINSSKARKLIQGTFQDEGMAPEHFLMDLEQAWTKDPIQAMPRYSLKILEGWKCYTKYLDDRGISREVQKEMMTGLNKGNMDDVDGELIVQPRIVIPHVFGGILRGWTMRLIDKRQYGNKYKHTGQFPKNTTLYNFDNVIKKYRWVIMVESPMSVLKLKSYGIHNVVATFGAEVNEGQINLLAKFDEVVVFPDGDKAGYRAMSRIDKRGNIVGLVHSLNERVPNVWIIDHGMDESHAVYGEINKDGFNDADPANYTADEVHQLLEDKVPADTWTWRFDERGIQKVHAYEVGVGAEERWD